MNNKFKQLQDVRIIDALKSGRPPLLNQLKIGNTRWCTAEPSCTHCYKGPKEKLTREPGIITPIFDYFKKMGLIYIGTGEAMTYPEGIEEIFLEMFKNRTDFQMAATSTNGIGLTTESPDLSNFNASLELMNYYSRAGKTGYNLVEIANDGYHDEMYKTMGASKDEIRARVEEAQKKYPGIRFMYKPYKKKEDCVLVKSGYAENLTGVRFQNDATFCAPELTFARFDETPYFLISFCIDEKGNVTSETISHKFGDEHNNGNVLKESIPKILLKRGRELDMPLKDYTDNFKREL